MKTRSLAASVTRVATLVIAAAMLTYAALQYAMMPGRSVWGLLAEHAWHVVVLGGLTYAVLHLLLHKQVVKPMRELYLKLYKISRGDRTPIDVNTNIREIQDITESVNLMLTLLQRVSSHPSAGKLRGSAQTLRTLASKGTDSLDTADREELVQTASELEELVRTFESIEAKAQNPDHKLL